MAYSIHADKINNINRVSSVEPYINNGLNWKDIPFHKQNRIMKDLKEIINQFLCLFCIVMIKMEK